MFRKDDPFTSKLAAEKVDFKVHHFEIIQAVLLLHGPLGKDGIADHSNLDPNQVARRLKEMMDNGFVKLTGRTVKSKSNREEREWELA
jgi:predicted transcriptional regulator